MLNLSSKELDTLSDKLGVELSPHAHMAIADAIKSVNPNFNANKFLARCMQSWEDNHLAPLNDEIPY
jgi:hypothetical protein